MKNIAILITSHNRVIITQQCLKALYESDITSDIQFEVFLVDDGSIDGTGEIIKRKFPRVHVIFGTGDLFWNQGMRLAWQHSANFMDFDYYVWLNDDTIIDKNGINELLDCFQIIVAANQFPSIIVGNCRAEHNSNIFSYGGRSNMGPILPNGEIQSCKFINGNFVLIHKSIFKKLGYLSNSYTHALGDYDYGLRALRAGFGCYTTRTYVATCMPNLGIPVWCDPSKSLKSRWYFLHSPKGLNIMEYKAFRREFWGYKWVWFVFKAYLRTLFPKYYNRLSKKL